MEETKRSTVIRRNKILQQLTKEGQVFINALSEEFAVSEVTIRNDLLKLEEKNLLVRARGGAMKFEGRVGIDYGITEKDKLSRDEKKEIGRKAATLISDSEIIIVDSGTTTAELVKNLDHLKDITVITNAFNIALLLMNKSNINLIIPGGIMRKNSQSLVGSIAEKSFRNFQVDKTFLGVNGIDPARGFYTPNIEEAYLNQQMINVSNETIVLADASKFNVRSFALICPINEVQKIVTDTAIKNEDREMLQKQGVEIILAN